MIKIFYIVFFLAGWSNSIAQDVNQVLKTGNEFYKQKEYAKAGAEYKKALVADPDTKTAKFNQANSLFRQDKKVEAAVSLNAVIQTTTDKDLLAKACYNKGVILSDQKNLEESIEAYKNALTK